MRKVYLAAVLFAFMCGTAAAADPAGEWLVKDGSARIRIEPCANGLWGFISWVREPGTDHKNPDPAKRTRSIIGVPILRSMTPVKPNRWEGEVYNADNGKMYSASIALVSDDVLKIEGCVLGGLFCGGENWTRAQQVEQQTPVQKPRDKPTASGVKPKDVAVVPPKVCYDG
jgi:uncharacterized protein (DUF2147 family)